MLQESHTLYMLCYKAPCWFTGEAVILLSARRRTSVPVVQIKHATGAKGPEIGKITDELVKWQLAHPHASQQDAEAWLSHLD